MNGCSCGFINLTEEQIRAKVAAGCVWRGWDFGFEVDGVEELPRVDFFEHPGRFGGSGESGQGLLEYALIIVLLAFGLILLARFLGVDIRVLWTPPATPIP